MGTLSTYLKTFYYENLMGYSSDKKIFVIGTGRSGTHWVGYILDSHPEISVQIEKNPNFEYSTKMALFPELRTDLLPKLINIYNHESKSVLPCTYADKSHPNIWIAEELSKAFPKAVFVAVWRDVYPTVASMLKHEGVLSWIKNWRNYPIPNEFLGIKKEFEDTYADLSEAGKCAIRWAAHKNKILFLKETLGKKIHVIHYEDIHANPENEVEKLSAFLELRKPFPTINVNHESLDKWKSDLDPTDINDIDLALSIWNELN